MYRHQKKKKVMYVRVIPCYTMLERHYIYVAGEIFWFSPPKIDHLLHERGLSKDLEEFISARLTITARGLLTAPTKSIENTLSSV